MTITLEAIKSAHAKVAEMIATFEKQATTEYRVPAAAIPLASGERFAGAVLNDDGSLAHYLILLPGEKESVQWEAAREWAIEQGGDLPTRREQSLLFANVKSAFASAWYWSGEQYESNSGSAWFQYFTSGGQGYDGKDCELRAVAVRRFIPSVI
ncbi:DUF1566 domain-containing protein [Paraburkholderia sp. SOS3]|uniref:DUF1566 domain-containing protein n=1 Tax=Paraburkholderia sp. SOS3 TaxID=1926494 RepID=UPI0009476FE8|nr:DUF1566 domain-containing protein [Paraburkholderia sp. SOS3]APR39991.1 hypothetical protein BTO02_33125 [Paraburkholderia sp. SOS3]